MAEGGREGDMQEGDRGISNTVEVRGFSKKTSQELMEMYFENSRRSGGGDLKEVKIRDEVAYITFKEAEVAQKVASLSNHQVDGQTLTVTLFHPLPPKPCYQNRVLIQGLNNAITEQLLRNFLETKTKAQVTEFLYGEEDGNVVVTFSDNIDIVQLGKIFQESSVEGVFLKVARVAISNCILVQNLHPSTSHDVILYYFENKRRSGGGDVERVEMKTEERYCLIYFEDPSVIDRVLGKSHNVDGVDFEIHLHHECLGRRSSRKNSDLYFRMSSPGNKDSATLENTDNQAKDKTSSSVSSNPEKESDFVEVQEWQENDGNNCTLPLWIKYKRAPDMKIIKCMKNIPCSWNFHLFWNFYTKTEPGKQMLLEILNKYNCSVAVFAEDEDLFIFEMIEKIFEQESDVVQLIHVVLDNVHKCARQFLYLDNILVDERIQGDVLQVVRQRKELNIARFELIGQQDFDALCVVCTEKDQTLVLHVVTEIIHMVKECFENHEETIHVEHKWQKVMRNFGYLQKLCEKYPNVTIISDKIEPAIMLKGPRDQSKPAADHFLQLLGTASSEVQEEIFSPECQFEIFTYPEMCGYIDNIAMEHSIVWIPNHQTKKIHLFSKRSGGKKGVDKLIRGCVQERIYPLAKGRTVFSTKIIRSLEELKTMHTGKIFFSLSHKGLLLTASDDIFESIDDAVQEIICEETDLEKFAIILNGDDTICASQGEEALKWRFIFDCPDTLQRLMENPVVKNAKLVYKSGKSPCICKDNSVQNFRKEFGELLKCHADTVQIHRAIIPEEGAKLFLINLNATDLFKKKLVFAYKVETTLFICGTKEYMGETIEQVNKIQDFVLNMNSQTSKIAVDDIPIKLMRKYINMYMLANTSKLRLELDEGAKVLAVTGLKNAVVREKAKLEQMLQSITTRKCEPVTCISHLSFFEALEVAQDIEEILKKQNLVCSWETNEKDCCIVVTAFDIETCEKAVKMIDTACVLDSKTLKIDESTWIIPSDSWQEEAHSICTKLGGKVKLWLDMGKDEVVYVNTHDIKDKVKNEVEGLFGRWNRKKYLSVEKRVFDQLTVHGKQKLRQLETKYNVAIDISKMIEKMGFIITGKDVKIQSVLEELDSEGRIILKSNLELSKQWFSSKDVEVVLVPGSKDSDLIILKDKSLLHCNQSNQAELRDKETNTEIIEIIPVFSLKISRPEDTKADLILPIDKSVRPLTFSCPHWNEGQSKDKHILSSALHHLFEFISSIGGEAVLEIRDKKIGTWDVRTFLKWMLFAYKDQVETKLKKTRLFLLTKDEEIWNFVKGVVHDAYLEDKSLVKEPQMSRSRKGLVLNRIRVKVQKGQLHEAQRERFYFKTETYFGIKTSSEAEVLVNTVNRSLDLKNGVISSSLLDKAGNIIQRELQQYQGKAGFGEVLKTGVGTLPKPCMVIFHGVLYAYEGHSDSVKVFQDFLAGCLEDANKEYRSIAFPPIGTGRLGYPKDLVASLLFQSVVKFEEAHPTSKLEEVIFVIYEKDQETLKVFEELYRRCVVPTGSEVIHPTETESHLSSEERVDDTLSESRDKENEKIYKSPTVKSLKRLRNRVLLVKLGGGKTYALPFSFATKPQIMYSEGFYCIMHDNVWYRFQQYSLDSLHLQNMQTKKYIKLCEYSESMDGTGARNKKHTNSSHNECQESLDSQTIAESSSMAMEAITNSSVETAQSAEGRIVTETDKLAAKRTEINKGETCETANEEKPIDESEDKSRTGATVSSGGNAVKGFEAEIPVDINIDQTHTGDPVQRFKGEFGRGVTDNISGDTDNTKEDESQASKEEVIQSKRRSARCRLLRKTGKKPKKEILIENVCEIEGIDRVENFGYTGSTSEGNVSNISSSPGAATEAISETPVADQKTVPAVSGVSKMLKYGQVEVQVKLGTFENEPHECLLVFWETQCLYKISDKNILRSAGSTVTQKWREHRNSRQFHQDVVLVTPGGNLRYTEIIHVACDINNINNAAKAGLMKADSEKMKTVVVPVTHDDSFQRDATKFCIEILKAVKELGTKLKFVKSVTLLIRGQYTFPFFNEVFEQQSEMYGSEKKTDDVFEQVKEMHVTEPHRASTNSSKNVLPKATVEMIKDPSSSVARSVPSSQKKTEVKEPVSPNITEVDRSGGDTGPLKAILPGKEQHKSTELQYSSEKQYCILVYDVKQDDASSLEDHIKSFGLTVKFVYPCKVGDALVICTNYKDKNTLLKILKQQYKVQSVSPQKIQGLTAAVDPLIGTKASKVKKKQDTVEQQSEINISHTESSHQFEVVTSQQLEMFVKETPEINVQKRSSENSISEDIENNKQIENVSQTDFLAIQSLEVYSEWTQKFNIRFTYEKDTLHIHGAHSDLSEEKKKEIEKEITTLRGKQKIELLYDPQEKMQFRSAVDEAKSDELLLVWDDPNKQVLVYSDNYDDMQKFKYRVEFKMGKKKLTGRSGRRFAKQGDTMPSLSEEETPTKKKIARSFSWSQDATNVEVFKTLEGIMVKVYKANILRLDVDCIVNAANDNLQHGDGVALVIAKGAGPEIDREGSEILKIRGRINVGEQCVTTAGNLPYDCVIHTVGPRWSDYYPHDARNIARCETDLFNSIIGCFIEAENRHLKSIALPAISSGIFAVPRDVCTEQYAKAVIHYSKTRTSLVLQEIHFIDMVPGIVNDMQLAFKRQLSCDGNAKHMVNDGDQTTAIDDLADSGNKHGKIPEKDVCETLPKDDGQTEEKQNHAAPLWPVIEQKYFKKEKFLIYKPNNKIEVNVYMADITKLTGMQVITCSDDRSGNGHGAIASTLLKTGKSKYESIKKKAFQKDVIHFGDVIITEGGDSNFQLVVHAVLPSFKDTISSQKHKEMVHKCYDRILDDINKLQKTSLTLPLLGAVCAELGYEGSAKLFLDSLEVFCNRTTTFNLKIIHIVDKDEHITQKIANEFIKHTERVRNHVLATHGKELKPTMDPSSHTSSVIPQEEISQVRPKNPMPGEQSKEDCSICLAEVKSPKTLSCGHTFCIKCVEKQFRTKQVCPKCGTFHGTIYGDQPEGGKMNISFHKQSLAGFDKTDTLIKIEYQIPSGTQGPNHPKPGKRYSGIIRTAYLPDTREGRKVCDLLKVAFGRRLIFTFGRSSQGEDTLIWNDIYHKTKFSGKNGYPDPGYLKRVQEQLAAKGVTVTDLVQGTPV